MTQFSNSDKQEHGQSAKEALEAILLECKKYSYIKEIIKGYRCGYKKYDKKQFYCNFLIVFQDDTKWIVNITTSFRSDRLKENQWDTYNIKEIDPSISMSILVYPDDLSEKDKDDFISYKYRIINKIHFSAIDDIVGQKELFELIENFANKNLTTGKRKDKQGNNFESYLANVFQDKNNLTRWKTSSAKLVGLHYDFFEKALSTFSVDKKQVTYIEATADKKVIGTLLTSGQPKTDVIVTVYFEDASTKCFTISCKKTNANSVGVHEYSADAFADVLDECNENLRRLLKEFQRVSSLSNFGEENASLLTKELKPYLRQLVRWVIGGYGGKYRNINQLANYIVISDEKELYIHTLEEYTELLLNPKNEKNFGTPFTWTYQHKKRGKSIKLKCKIIK